MALTIPINLNIENLAELNAQVAKMAGAAGGAGAGAAGGRGVSRPLGQDEARERALSLIEQESVLGSS